MFNFLFMEGSYEGRKVGRFDADWGFISTAEVNDGELPYETAVAHNAYRDGGDMVIVEAYDTREGAVLGHERWVKKMTAKNLPKQLVDCCNAEIAQLATMDGKPLVYKRKGA
jgi:hypothetical protein